MSLCWNFGVAGSWFGRVTGFGGFVEMVQSIYTITLRLLLSAKNKISVIVCRTVHFIYAAVLQWQEVSNHGHMRKFTHWLLGLTFGWVLIVNFFKVDISHAETSRASSTLAFLQRNISHCPRQPKTLASQALTRPNLEYGVYIWDPHTKSNPPRGSTAESRQRNLSLETTGRRAVWQTC